MMIRITNREELRQVLEKLEQDGFMWSSEDKPTVFYNTMCGNVDNCEIMISTHIGYDAQQSKPSLTLTWAELTQASDFLANGLEGY